MITPQFLDCFEVSLRKAYNRYLRVGAAPITPGSPEFMKTAGGRGDFVQKFMITFTEQQKVLLQEIERGGHREATKILDQIHMQVRNKMAAVDYGKAVPEQKAFQKAVLELKREVRSTFY